MRQDKFLANVSPEPNSGCWLWTGALHAQFGYGMAAALVNGKWNSTTAHRVSWQTFRGEIPKGLCILHRCDVPPCVNPDHLFLGNKRDNAEDRVAKGRNGRGGAPLTGSQIVEIKAASNSESLPILAKRYGVYTATISRVRNNKTYAWVQM